VPIGDLNFRWLAQQFSLEGRTAVVTGGARGLGRGIAEGLSTAGARVIVTTRTMPPSECRSDAIEYLEAKLDDPRDLDVVVRGLVLKAPEIQILINNVGATWVAPLAEYDEMSFLDVIRTNVLVGFGLARRLVPSLRASGSLLNPSRIVNVGSVAGIRPQGADNFAYTASKAAVHMLTRQLALELATSSITVNAIAPGPIEVGIAARSVEAQGAAAVISTVPMQRLGRAGDVAAAAVFLASPAASYITGVVLPVDGGISAS